MTDYIYKVLLIYPNAELAGVTQFIADNFDPAGAEKWFVPLSANGSAPSSHGITSFHATKAQANMWLEMYAQQLGGTLPEGFTELPRTSQRAYITGAGDAMWFNNGIYFTAVFNDEGESPDVDAALEFCDLQRVTASL